MTARIVFTHANGFPASTYALLLTQLRQRGMVVDALEKVGHDPKYPVSNNWPHLVQQLADFTRAQLTHGERAFLVGHSLGGILSLMCAALHPELACGVLLIDAPVLGGWRAKVLGLGKRVGLIGAYSPGRISHKRRDRWPDAAAALAHFQRKPAFARWQPQVLQDFIDHGTHDIDGERVLCFERDIETEIYNGLPHQIDRLLKHHPLKCAAAFIGGTDSVEMRQAGYAPTHKFVQGRVMMLAGSHLFPMEQPLATAAAIEASLRNLGADF